MAENAGKPISLDQWKAQARQGAAPADARLYKQYTADSIKAVEGSERKVAFTISTGAIDRDRDTINVDGWHLDDYRKNPVVLWAHDRWGLPIGKAESIRIAAGQLKAVAEFATADENPLAENVLRLLKGGYLRATSVGFLPVKYLWNEERGGIDFAEQLLLEFSIVSVPSNPEALADAKSAGIDMAPMKAWAERILDGVDGAGLWVPREKALAAFKALAEPRIVVPADFDPTPVLAEFSKRGRVLSRANEERIRGARTAADAVGAALDEVLSTLSPEEDPDEGKSKASPVLYVAPEPTVLVDPAAVKAAVVAAVSDAVRAGVNHARGRID